MGSALPIGAGVTLSFLLVTHGYHFGVRFDLADTCTIGRSSSCVIQLLDEKVSRVHVTITSGPEGYVVRDEGSSNGTGINGELMLEPTRLRPGDELAVGNNLLLFDPELQILRDRGGVGAVILTQEGEADSISEASGLTPDTADSIPFSPASLVTAVARVLASNRSTGFSWLLLEALARGVGAERAALLRVRGEGRMPQALLTFPAQSRVGVPKALVDRVLEREKPQRLEDSVSELKVRGGRTRIEARTGTSLCVPLTRRGRMEALLYVDSQVRRAFHSVPLPMVEDVATLALPVFFSSLGIPGDDTPPPGAGEAPVAESLPMKQVVEAAESYAGNDRPVLLVGEAGSGREDIARYIHRRSNRRHAPFVALHCDALSLERMESELFGHEKGTFPDARFRRAGQFEEADGGTVFLRGVDELSLSVQAKLQRAMQEVRFYRQGGGRPVVSDARIIAGVRRDLTRKVRHEEFREDLYRALDEQSAQIPPLRERAPDLQILIARLFDRFNATANTKISSIEEGALEQLQRHPWRGNLRELEQILRKALVLTTTDRVKTETVRQVLETQVDPVGVDQSLTLGQAIRGLESRLLIEAVVKAIGRKSHAAAILGISREDLDRKLAEYGIDLAREVGHTIY